jgi:hypothetical protein
VIDEAITHIRRNRAAIEKLRTFGGQGQLVLAISPGYDSDPVTVELGLSCDTENLLNHIIKDIHGVQAHWYRELREEIDRGLLFLSEDK